MGVTSGVLITRQNIGGLNGIVQGIIFSQGQAVTIANTTTETTGLTTTGGFGTLTLPAGFIKSGTQIVIRASGSVQTDVALPTLQVRPTYGATQLSSSGAVSFLAQIVTPTLFEYTCTIFVPTAGASATARVSSIMWLNNLNNTSLGNAPSTATIDTTSSNALDVKFTWGTANANNSLVVNGCFIEVYQ